MSWLRPLFAPEGIAVVGASRDPRKLGAVMLRSLRTFTGPVAGVNPHDPDPAAGRYRSVAAAADAAGGPLDLAVLCMPAAASAQALTDAARGGARAALVCSGGYAEAGGAGAGFQRDLAAAAADAGLALLGPNTSGFLVPRLRLYASFVPGAASIPAGPVAGVAASGGVNHALAYLLAEAGLGVSLAVGLDNAVDVSAPDVLAHLADDEHTRAVALHVESVPDGPALISAVRHLTARKPVAALVVGRSDVTDLAQSHTGALATSWRTARAALQGAVACAGEHEGTPLLLADLAHPDIEDVEIKPLRVTQDGLVALDAVLRTRKERHPMIAPIADGTVPWPEDLARAYTAAGWWHGQALGSEIAAAADARSTATALVDCATRISYASLAARADAVASRLTGELGLERGDRIVVQLPNCWQFVVLTLGCLRAGIVPVMALPAHRRHELAYLCEHSEARALAVPGVLRDFDHQDMAAQLRAGSATLRHILVAGEDVRPGHLALTALCTEPGDPAADRARWDADSPDGRDVAVFLLSGGTTGLPKLIARTHNDYSYNARASAELCRLGQDTVYLGTLPASHNFPLACPGILGTLLSGGRVIMLSSAQPQAVFPAVEREGVTMAAVVPAIAQRWLAYAEEHGAAQLRTLRVLQVGGARLADELARRVRPVLGATLQQVFGMAEGLLNYTRRSRRGHLQHPGQAAEPRRRSAHRGRRRRRPARRRGRPAAYARAVHAVRLLPGAGAERTGLHPGRLVCQRRRRAPPPGRQSHRGGPGQGHDQPWRGEDLRRGSREPRLPAAGHRPGRRGGCARRRPRRAGMRLRGAAGRGGHHPGGHPGWHGGGRGGQVQVAGTAGDRRRAAHHQGGQAG